MDLRHLINLNLAVLGVLASLLVGLGQPNALLPVGTLLAAVLAWWYCDLRERVAVSRWVVNAAVLIAAAVAALRFAQVGGAPDAAVAADGLLGLMLVLFFERKTTRTWWDLLSLSLLLVFLSTAFIHGPLFALVLTVYFFFLLTAMALLSLHRQREASREAAANGFAGRRVFRTRVDWWRLVGVGLATLVVGPLSLYLRFRPLPEESEGDETPVAESGVGSAGNGHRGAAGLAGNWRARVLELAARGGPRQAGPGEEFWWRMGRLTLAGLLVGVLIFGITPRFGGIDFTPRGHGGRWQSGSGALQRTVGFNDQVRLGELGSVIEDTQRVLGIRFYRRGGGEPQRIQGSLFLRGAVMSHYQDGQWEYRSGGGSAQARQVHVEPAKWPASLLLQEIRLDPLDRPELFCVWPFFYLNQDERVVFDRQTQRLTRRGSLRRRPFSYELATTGIVAGRQIDLLPADGPVDAQALLQWPAADVPRLAALARQWTARSGLPAADVLGRARMLERELRSSDRFRYRLGDHDRDPRLDPIEDFVVNDPRGHCEHFATALTLMLRSQGLPARMIVGYKTDEYNYVEERYWARQSHAHTWVEAYLPAAAVPAEVRGRDPLLDWSYGAWLRLDPTPLDDDELSMVEYLKRTFSQWQAATRTAWSQHVMQMTGSRQDTLIYRPIVQALRRSLARLSDSNWWVGGEPLDLGQVLASPWRLIRSPLLLVAGGVLVCAAFVTLVVLRRRSFRGAPRGAKRIFAPRRLNGVPGSDAGFYRRWESVLRRWGLDRGTAQTPREFAQQAGGQLAEAAGEPQLREASQRVIDAFYQVRFGGAALDEPAVALVEDALARIQQAVRTTRGRANGA